MRNRGVELEGKARGERPEGSSKPLAEIACKEEDAEGTPNVFETPCREKVLEEDWFEDVAAYG